jgi:hypothetical protein
MQKAETHRNAIGLTARSLTSPAITAVRKRDLSLVQPPQCLSFCPCLSALACRIGNGYDHAKSRHLFRDFVEASAGITITGEEIVVRYQKLAHNPLLIAAGFDKMNVAVPWLGGKRLRLVFG